MKQLIACAVVAGCVCAVEAKTVIYQNDFSTRTSAVKAEPGPWRTYTYSLGRLAYSYSDYWYAYSPDIHWLDPTQTQDGWVHGGACGYQDYAGGWFPGSFVSVNNEDECPGDTTHPFGVFRFNGMHHTWCRLLQPIGNSFSNGVVRYSVDMRPPRVWGAKKYGGWGPLFRFYPAFRRDLRCPEIGDAAEENPCAIGFTWRGTTESDDNVLVEGAVRNIRHGADPNYIGGQVVPGNWYRCHVTLDIDNEKCFMSMDDMGGTVPLWDTMPVEADVLRMDAEMGWRWPITEERGPIDGIAFQVEGVNSYAVVTNMPSFTNIKVEWKAPGTETFLSCYENDFTTRRMRTLQPTAASFVYPEITTRDETATNLAYAKLWQTNDLPTGNSEGLLVTKPLNGGNSQEEIGFDNWRRIYSTGWGNAFVVDEGGDRRFCVHWPYSDNSGAFGCFAQPLGETLTSGKVRLLVDLRTPDKFWATWNSGLYACLGNQDHADSYGKGSVTTYITCAGVGCGGETLSYPEYKTNGQWPNGETDYTCAMSHWYRTETIADLDARTFTYRLYDLESDTPDVAVFERTGLAFALDSATPNIAAFSLSAYGPGRDMPGAMLFDNVVVWKNWNTDTGTGDEIYRNDFSVRTRPSVRVAENLGDAPNLIVEEKDRWVVRGGDADWVKRVLGDNGNPCASFFCIESEAYAMQDLGTPVRNGRLTFSADIRPPNLWHQGVGGREASVYLGGEELAQGNRFNGVSIWGKSATLFGFDGGGSSWSTAKIATRVAAYCQDGSSTKYFGFTTDPSHWYRFKATVDMKTRKVAVDVYDMGTTHPERTTPDGTLVGSMKDLAFKNDQVEELTTICLRGVGQRTDKPWMAEDFGAMFVDNLKAELTPPGCMLIVR